MKKLLVTLLVIALLIAGAAYYVLSGAGNLIRAQIEQQGSQYLDTTVAVSKVDLLLSEGRMTISDLHIKNPAGFSQQDAFNVDAVTLDLGGAISEPYVVQSIVINAPEILYETDANGKGNLIVLNDNLATNLPQTNKQSSSDDVNPLVIVENVTVSNTRLKINFENLDTVNVALDKKVYDITLPTFNAGPLGSPNGLPADQIGLAIVNAMLDNVIAQAKTAAKKRLAEEAKKKLNEKLDEQKDKLLDKASDKLKDLLS